MIERQITNELLQLIGEYPVVTLLGPRQAGKTTLAKGILASYEYCMWNEMYDNLLILKILHYLKNS